MMTSSEARNTESSLSCVAWKVYLDGTTSDSKTVKKEGKAMGGWGAEKAQLRAFYQASKQTT